MGQLFTGSIAIRGIRGPIPSGYILGRTDSGSGPPQLVSLPALGAKMVQSGIPVTRLSSLQDVAFSTLTDKQHLQYDAVAGKWVNVAPPALATLTDVVEAAPANGQVLTFETATNKWKNKNPSANQVNNYLGPTTVGLTSFQPGIGATLTHGNWGGVPALISAGMNVTDIRFYATAAAASAVVTPAIYADNAGAPGALIAVGSATTGVVQGLNSFACAFSASTDQVIWLGVLVETADIILATCDYKPNAYFAAAGPLPPNTAPTATFQIGTCWASMWADCTPVGITSSPLSSLSPAVLGLVMSGALSTSVSLAAAETVGLVMTALLQTGVVAVTGAVSVGLTMSAVISIAGSVLDLGAVPMVIGVNMTAKLAATAMTFGAVNGSPASTSPISTAMPSGITAGQLLLSVAEKNGVDSGAFSVNAGWTIIQQTHSANYSKAVAYRIATGSGDGITWSWANSSVLVNTNASRFTGGVNSANPIGNSSINTGNSTSAVPTAIVSARGGSFFLSVSGVPGTQPAAPGGWTGAFGGGGSNPAEEMSTLAVPGIGTSSGTPASTVPSGQWCVILFEVCTL